MSNTEYETINSEQLIDINTNFKITAGPGAGKTYWLVKHIKHVLEESKILKSASKIACITYTTVAAEEINERLKANSDRVEISTIHSFLYNNVVKPYIYLLKDENGQCVVNYQKMNGHTNNVASPGKINEWIRENKLYKHVNEKRIKHIFLDLDWFLDDSLVLKAKKEYNRGYMEDKLLSYKKLYWVEGIIHHEDVLYFSYRILKENAILREFLSIKFPYIFLDEFQDTNPIQTEIVKWFAQGKSIIGVIGDPAQSIYKFNGASRKEFLNFNLRSQTNYLIENNRRSTDNILNVLNYIRKGDKIIQKGVRKCQGIKVSYVKSSDPAHIIKRFNECRILLGLKNEYCIVARSNDGVIKLKNNDNDCDCKVWDKVYKAHFYRASFLEHLLLAQEYANDHRYEVAMKEILKIFKGVKNAELKEPFKSCKELNDIEKRSCAVSILEYLVNNRLCNIEKKLINFYNELNSDILEKLNLKISQIGKKGKIKECYESVAFKELVNNLKLNEEKSTNIRTIHKTKGAEFESVLVYMEDDKELENIINPNIEYEEDDCRIYYVAFSRAKDFLCIAIPEEMDVEKFNDLGIVSIDDIICNVDK
ncbi:MAG: ATP-dependent helicase [Clostridium sp.]|uniref:UvrD-helicase domain-containing protein n=1 Tax=Clostridium sp. TaxID=1506 RepID=UPI0039EA89A3